MEDIIRIFVWPHLSTRNTERHPSNLLGDSNFHTIRLVTQNLLKKDKDFHFYYPIPRGSLEIYSKTFKKHIDNFTFIEREMLGTGSGSKLYVDLKGLTKGWKSSYIPDIFWCNVVEVTNYLQQFMFARGHRPMTLSYTHWPPEEISRTYKHEFDYKWGGLVPELSYFSNYTSSAYNACNSMWARKLLLKALSFVENPELKMHLDQTVRPLYLGNPIDEIMEHKTNDRFDKFTLLFNHRWNQYTGYTEFRKAIHRFIKKYPEEEFQIIFTSPNKTTGVVSDDYNIPKKYIYPKIGNFTWVEYCKLLWKADMVVGMHTGVNHWSLSYPEGVSADCIPLYREGIFFDEMVEKMPLEDQDPYCHFKFDDKNYDDFCSNLKVIMDNKDKYREIAKKYGKFFREEWSWEHRIEDWKNLFVNLKNRIIPVKESPEMYKFMLQFMRNRQKISWEQLKKCTGSGDQRSLLKYRNQIEVNNDWLKDNPKSSGVEFIKVKEPPKEILNQKLSIKDEDKRQMGLDMFEE